MVDLECVDLPEFILLNLSIFFLPRLGQGAEARQGLREQFLDVALRVAHGGVEVHAVGLHLDLTTTLGAAKRHGKAMVNGLVGKHRTPSIFP